MSWDNKVVWSEGMFLRPQHFQQQDRYVEKLVRSRIAELAPHPWGISQLEINRELLTIGKFGLSSRFALATDERAGFLSLGLARIVEIRADRNIVLDDRYIPPCLVCSAVPGLAALITELQGLFHHRGEALAARILPTTGARGVAEINDYLLLQVVNRFEPLITHLTRGADPHP